MEKPFVLLADDNEATCTLIMALLRHEFVVDVVHDGAEAIEKLKSRQYSALVLDLLMPVLDGYGVLDFVARERPEMLSHVLVVTASVSPREQGRMKDYPVCRVLTKPFEVEVLQTLVRQCAGIGNEPFFRGPIVSGGVLLLLADLLRRV
ncbi:MAG: response regulator [Acidobacteriota bacterium]